MVTPKGWKSKNFVTFRRIQGAGSAHLDPRRFLYEHNIGSIFAPLCKEGSVRRRGLADVVTPESQPWFRDMAHISDAGESMWWSWAPGGDGVCGGSTKATVLEGPAPGV